MARITEMHVPESGLPTGEITQQNGLTFKNQDIARSLTVVINHPTQSSGAVVADHAAALVISPEALPPNGTLPVYRARTGNADVFTLDDIDNACWPAHIYASNPGINQRVISQILAPHKLRASVQVKRNTAFQEKCAGQKTPWRNNDDVILLSVINGLLNGGC